MQTQPDCRCVAALIVAASIAGAALSGCATTRPSPDELMDDGLVRVPNTLLDELYVAPNVSLGNYKRVMLDPIEVNFKEGWRKNHPDLRDKEFEKLCATL